MDRGFFNTTEVSDMGNDPTGPTDPIDDEGDHDSDTLDDALTDESSAYDDTDPDRERSTVVGTETGLEENVAGALSYLLGPLTGILFYLLEDENPFVRFHAAQSTILFGGLFVLGVGLSIVTTVLALIPVLGWLIAAVLGLVALLLVPGGFVVWLFLMYNAYTGGEYEVPVVAKYARQYAPREADPLEDNVL